MKTKIKIPQFDDHEEEAKFWETHNVSDFIGELTQVKARFAKNLSQGITIRFDEPTLSKLRKIASGKGLGPTTLARMWILEHLTQQA